MITFVRLFVIFVVVAGLVFAEKGIIENQAVPYATNVMNEECAIGNTTFDVNNKKVIIASRHMRNDSKGIQLEIR